MKNIKILIVLMVIFNSNLTNAQYQSLFGSNSTSWNIRGTEFTGDYTDSLSVCCDTNINGNLYKKINYYKFHPITHSSTLQNVNGFLREDTTQGKTWYFTTTDTNERLIMNLNLTTNDSFQLFNFNNNSSFYYQVDSVYTKNGKKHIRLDATPSYLLPTINEKFTMIEGVGPNIGIPYSDDNWVLKRTYLLCSYKNKLIDYQNSSTLYNGICFTLPVGINEQQTNPKIILYPNPTPTVLNLDISKAIIVISLTLYDIAGRTIKTFSSTQRELDLSDFVSGQYFLKIETEKGVITKKVMLE